LDIDGGIRVVMETDPQRPEDWPTDPEEQRNKMQAIRKTIENRVAGMQGVSEPRVYPQGTNRIVVELPGVKDPKAALDTIKDTAALEFYYLRDVQNSNNPLGQWRMEAPVGEGGSYIFTGPRGETIDSEKDKQAVMEKVVNTAKNPPILSGKDLLPTAQANINSRNQIVINIEFNRDGRRLFADFTRKHVNDYLAVFFDQKLLTAPSITEAIPSGKAEITGFRSLPEAKKISEYLNSGALPIPLEVLNYESVEPTIGQDTVQRVLVAGLTGLFLVMVFMLIYYRLPGMIANIALCLYALFVLGVFALMGATISLAGLAALIISIGMAVDANILIFERLKEELKGGKTLRAAIDAGFNRAFTAIFDSNMCTAITCAILMAYGTPKVQGFAMTLLIGVAISMFTAITVTRTILHLLVGWQWAQKPSLYGLTSRYLSMTHLKLNIVGKRNYYFVISSVLIIFGLVFWGSYGLKRGIEFKSGTMMQASFENKVSLSQMRGVVGQHAKSFEVQLGKGGKMAFIKTEPLKEAKVVQLQDSLNAVAPLATRDDEGNPRFDLVSSVDPVISEELTRNAVWSVIIASLGIVLYMTIRFAIGGLAAGFKFGVCAIIALVHDSLFILGLFAVLGKVFGWEIDSLFVTAVLTVIGYSVHDTIVVFDRIRENLRHRMRGESFEDLCNRSILQTLTRSINTSLTVVLTLTTLIVFGGPILQQFYVALLVGIVIGTYSSIFNATPLVIVWEQIATGTRPKKKEFEDKALVERPVIPAAGETVDTETEELDGQIDSGSDASDTGRIKRKPTKKRRY